MHEGAEADVSADPENILKKPVKKPTGETLSRLKQTPDMKEAPDWTNAVGHLGCLHPHCDFYL